MSLRQRLERMEQIELERWIDDRIGEEAERMAKESGRGVEEITAELRQSAGRIMRFGLDAEIRSMAREFSMSEDEVRAELDAVREKQPA